MSKKKNAGLTRRASGLMALEPRFMFDGAAVGEAAKTLATADTDSGLLHFAAGAENTTVALSAAQQQAEAMVANFLQRPDATQQMFTLFNGGQAAPSAVWQEAANSLIAGVQSGSVSVRVELRTNAELQGAKGAFSSDGTTGQATIYLNSDWLVGTPSTGIGGADSASINTVLVEELGHYLDAVLNAGGDTAGDEGEMFSRFLIDGTNPLTVSFLSAQDDHGTLALDGQSVAAEFAGFTFVNAYEMVYDQNNNTNTLGVVSGAVDTTERWADKEQNLHYFDSTHALGQVVINDGSNGVNFSGNDVSATALVINGNTYYGWISRPIKANGLVRGFYFWTDSRFVDFATAQADGNQDGDNSLNNRGFLLVVDQTWFSSQITSTGISESINNLKDGNHGTITVANVGSSSDRVDSALNSLLPSTAPTLALTADTAANAAVELGTDSSIDGWKYASGTLSASSSDYTLTATTSATGNVLTNDTTTDASMNVVAITSTETGQKVSTLTSGSYQVQGKYGVLTIDSLGNYTYTPSNSAAIVDALRTGTVTETFSYSVATKTGTTAASTLTVSVQASNDAPIAYNDYNNAKEKLSTDPTLGYNASGNVLTNDTDVDSGDSKSIVGGSTVTNTPITVNAVIGATQLVFTASAGGSLYSTADNRELFYKSGSSYYAVVDSNLKNIYVVAKSADKTTYTFNADPAKYWDGTAYQNITNISNFFITHSAVAFSEQGDFSLANTSVVNSITLSGNDKTATASSSASSAYTDLTFTGDVRSSYQVGMLLQGNNVPAGTYVQSISLVSGNTVIRTTNALSSVTTVTSLTFYGKTTQAGTYGSLDIYANGDYVYTTNTDISALSSGQSGTETFTYTMRDTAGVQSRANVVITVYGSGTNDPITTDDTVSITEQGVTNGGNTSNGAAATVSTTTVATGVLGNDLESSAATSYGTSYVSAVRNELNTSSSTITTSSRTGTATSTSVIGAYGSIVMKDDGTYTYSLSNSANVVQALQSGVAVTDTFYYQVKNTLTGPGISWAKLVVTINGANDIPSAVNDTASVTVDGTTTATGSVLTNDSDVDAGDTRAVTQASYSSTTAVISAGTLTLTGQYGNLTLNSNGTYTYTLRNSDANVQALTFGQQVHDTFTYTVQDSKSATSTATLDITVTGAEHRPTIAVTGVDVSEGSDAVFQIDVGKSSAGSVLIDLALSNVTATGGAASPADYNNATYYWSTDNVNWTQVSGSQISVSVSSTAATTFYVKVGTNQDNVYEGVESFVLNASFSDATLKYQNGTSGALRVNSYSDGTANVYDDGSGPDPDGAGPAVPDDDRPTLLVAGVSNVSEGSYAIFTVTLDKAVAANTGIRLQLTDLSASVTNDLNSTTMEVVTDLANTPINSGTSVLNGNTFTLPGGTTTFYVRVLTKQDSVYEGSENFKLTASFTAANLLYADRTGTNTTVRSGATAYDSSTILDDGTGSVYNGLGGNTGTPDDDRTISVAGYGPVNEGSQYAMFTVTATPGQQLDLALQNATSGTAATWSGFATVQFSTDGTNWTTYDASHKPTVPAGGKVYVRVDISSEADAPYEGAETFALKASFTSNTAKSAAADTTIVDDGTGTKYGPNVDPTNGPATSTSNLDNDQGGPITVTGGSYNENSPRAVFTVNATLGQVLTLDVQNAAEPGKAPTGRNEGKPNDSLDTAPIYYSIDGGATWRLYTGPITAGNVPVLVAVDITNERDDVYEGEEQLKLVVTSGAQSASAYSSIFDDGTGTVTREITAQTTNDTGANDPSVVKDDDRPKAALPPVVQPPVAPPAPPAELTPPPPPPAASPAFASALQPLAPRTSAVAEPPLAMADVKTSSSGYQIPVNETAPPGLTINRGVTDQFVQGTQIATKISLPFDAFIHSNKDAVIKLEAKQADNSSLPKWVQFDPATGVFEVTPPKGFKGKIDLKVIARDEDGREATAIFQMFVGEQTQNQTPGLQSRHSFSEKLRMAGKRPVTLVRVAEVRTPAHAREAVVVKAHAG